MGLLGARPRRLVAVASLVGILVGCSGSPSHESGPTTAAPRPTTAAPSTTLAGPPESSPPHRNAPAVIPTGCPPFATAPDAVQAFCEPFDQPSTNSAGTRSGALDSVLWGTSIVTGSPGNPVPSVPSECGATGLVNYPDNIEICNGQLVDTTNDGGHVSSLAMYPRQPFDFAGRTGTIEFDVSNDTQGNHAAWPELWVTDQPVPDPFTHEASWQSFPRYGFGIRFAGCTDTSGAGATCSEGDGGVGVDSAVVVNKYVGDDSFGGQGLKVLGFGSVLKSGPGEVNHYEIRVSQKQIDVYGTNPYRGALNLKATPIVHLATIPNANLGFTRGLVWFEDVHYNGDKFGTQRVHTFRWDNLAFDGPVLPRDLGFDLPDNTAPDTNVGGLGLPGIDTAWIIHPNSSRDLTVTGVTNTGDASGALLEFNFYPEGVAPVTLKVAVNGHPLTIPWPYPDSTVDSPRTIAVSVPLDDIATGNNTVSFSTGDYTLDVMNLDLILQGAGGTPALPSTTTIPPT